MCRFVDQLDGFLGRSCAGARYLERNIGDPIRLITFQLCRARETPRAVDESTNAEPDGLGTVESFDGLVADRQRFTRGFYGADIRIRRASGGRRIQSLS